MPTAYRAASLGSLVGRFAAKPELQDVLDQSSQLNHYIAKSYIQIIYSQYCPSSPADVKPVLFSLYPGAIPGHDLDRLDVCKMWRPFPSR